MNRVMPEDGDEWSSMRIGLIEDERSSMRIGLIDEDRID